jgi:hypothetical protein
MKILTGFELVIVGVKATSNTVTMCGLHTWASCRKAGKSLQGAGGSWWELEGVWRRSVGDHFLSGSRVMCNWCQRCVDWAGVTWRSPSICCILHCSSRGVPHQDTLNTRRNHQPAAALTVVTIRTTCFNANKFDSSQPSAQSYTNSGNYTYHLLQRQQI